MEENNPANYCAYCERYLGFRGFCSQKCHDRYYDNTLNNLHIAEETRRGE